MKISQCIFDTFKIITSDKDFYIIINSHLLYRKKAPFENGAFFMHKYFLTLFLLF